MCFCDNMPVGICSFFMHLKLEQRENIKFYVKTRKLEIKTLDMLQEAYSNETMGDVNNVNGPDVHSMQFLAYFQALCSWRVALSSYCPPVTFYPT